MAWWRAHDEAVDDPKLQRLPADQFRAWFNLVCLASRNGGKLPPMADIAFRLRKSEKDCQRMLDALIAAKLFDVTADGTEPHNWNGRQYKSDVSTGRVRAFRERKKKRSSGTDETVSRNAPETEQSRRQAPSGLVSASADGSSKVAPRASAPGGARAPVPREALSLTGASSIWTIRLKAHRPNRPWPPEHGPPPESDQDNPNLDAQQRRDWRRYHGLTPDWRKVAA